MRGAGASRLLPEAALVRAPTERQASVPALRLSARWVSAVKRWLLRAPFSKGVGASAVLGSSVREAPHRQPELAWPPASQQAAAPLSPCSLTSSSLLEFA